MTTKKENSKDSPAEGNDQSSVSGPSSEQPAAGPWTKGEPEKEDDYLIKYRHQDFEGVRISTARYLPDRGWLNIFPKMQIIEYAEIYE